LPQRDLFLRTGSVTKKHHTAGRSTGIGREISPKPRIFYLKSPEEHALIEITIAAGREKSTFFLFL
jgi:hypothetical protein